MKAKPAIILLVIIFVGPILLSWWFVNSDIDWSARGLSNHGELIRPPIDLLGQAATEPVFEFAALAPSHWAIFSLEKETCEDACQERINKLALIHSVMGSSQDRLRVFALAPDGKAGDDATLLVDSQATEALLGLVAASDSGITLPQYFVVDWRKQLMMRFPADAPPGDIKKDLSKLLRASKIR